MTATSTWYPEDVIDAKSIMGIFSLDLSKPIDLNIHADGAALDSVMEIIDKYTVE